MRLLRSIPLVGVAVAALVASTGGAGMAASSSGGNTKLPGSLPTWATAAHRVGSANGSQPVGFRVYLRNRDDAGAAAYARAVSTKGNALYGKFLTPAQFRSRFSPDGRRTSARVETWLRGPGLHDRHVPTNNKYVEAIGTVAQAAKAFDTSFATYRYQGQTMRSNTTALSVPSSLSAGARQ